MSVSHTSIVLSFAALFVVAADGSRAGETTMLEVRGAASEAEGGAASSERLTRVIVKLHEEETPLTPPAEANGGSVVDRHKDQLANAMSGRGAVQVRSISGRPLMVLEVTPEGMANLLASPFVESVEEDQLAAPQLSAPESTAGDNQPGPDLSAPQ